MGTLQVVIEKVQNGYVITSTDDDGLVRTSVAMSHGAVNEAVSIELPRMITRYELAQTISKEETKGAKK